MNRLSLALCLVLLWIPSAALAQRVLVYDDTTAVVEGREAANRLGWTAVTTSTPTGFANAWQAATEPFDLLLIDVTVGLTPVAIPPISEHLDAGRPVLIGYANLERNNTLASVLGLVRETTLQTGQAYTLFSTEESGVDLFRLADTLPNPIRSGPVGDPPGAIFLPQGRGSVLARLNSETGAHAIVSSRDGLVLFNAIHSHWLGVRDGDDDGVRDSVELLANEMRYLATARRDIYLAYTDLIQPPDDDGSGSDGSGSDGSGSDGSGGSSSGSEGSGGSGAGNEGSGEPPAPVFRTAIERLAEARDRDVVWAETPDALLEAVAREVYSGLYIEVRDPSAIDARLAAAIAGARERGRPVVLLSPGLRDAPETRTALGFDTDAASPIASTIVAGPSALERALLRFPTPVDPFGVSWDDAASSRSILVDLGPLVPLARLPGGADAVVLAGDPDGGLIVGSFLLSELDGQDDNGDGISGVPALLDNLFDFAQNAGPLAALLTDAGSADETSDLLAASRLAGLYPIVCTDAATFVDALDDTAVELALVEALTDAATWQDPALVDAVGTWLDADLPLVMTGSGLSTSPALLAQADVDIDRATRAAGVRREAFNLGRVFQLPRPAPADYPLAEGSGDATVLLEGDDASVLGRFDDDGAAILRTRNGRAIVNGFTSQAFGAGDVDRDSTRDILQLLRNQIASVRTPQTALVLDDAADALPSRLAGGYRRAGLRTQVVTTAAAFVDAWDAGTFQQLGIDSSATDTIADSEVRSRIEQWIASNRGLVVAFPNFDAHPELATLFGIQVADLPATDDDGLPNRELLSPRLNDPDRIFQVPNDVGSPLRFGPSPFTDRGDELLPGPGIVPVAFFDSTRGPMAIALTGGGNIAINTFPPRDLLDTRFTDPAGLFANQAVRIGRVPVAVLAPELTLEEGTSLVLDASASFDPFEEPLTFAWDLDGDGNFDDGAGPSPRLDGSALDGPSTRRVSVRVTNASGYRDTATAVVTVRNLPPTVNAGPDRTINQGQAVVLTPTVVDVPGDTLTFAWDLGDGTTSTERNVTHEYDEPGVYEAVLTVTDDDGGTATDAVRITLRNLPPNVTVSRSPATGEEGRTAFTFTATASDPGGDAFLVTWDLGDGSPTVSGPIVEHTYRDNGNFRAVARAMDFRGAYATANVQTAVANVAPTITSTPTSLIADEGVAWTYPAAATDPGDDVLSWRLLSGPTGMTVNDDGVVSWTPGAADGQSWTPDSGTFEPVEVRLRVLDDDGAAVDHEPFTLTIRFIDADGGGAPDSCETYWGFDPDIAADDTSDPDGDGLTVADECIRGLDPTVFSGPSAPELDGPRDRETLRSARVELRVFHATDPDGDILTYEFEVASDDAFDDILFTETDVPQGTGPRTAAVFDEAFVEDALHFWRARAFDGEIHGPWSETGSFSVNRENRPPTAPEIRSPRIATGETRPVIRIGNATDPDNDRLRYAVELYRGVQATPESRVLQLDNLPEDPSGETAVPLDADLLATPLADGQRWLLRVRARDFGRFGAFALSEFLVDTQVNAPPSPPVPTVPGTDDIVPVRFGATFGWTNATDSNGDPLTYALEIALEPTFARLLVPAIVGINPTGSDDTSVVVPLQLADQTTYHWRVAAFDGKERSAWAASSFRTIVPNNPPTPPVPRLPDAGAVLRSADGVVQLLVDNAVDPDGQLLTYEFQLSEEPDMTPVFTTPEDTTAVEGGSAVTFVDVTLPLGRDYYWRVRALDGVVAGAWSPVRAFSLRAPAPGDAGIGDAGTDAGVGPRPPPANWGTAGGGGGCSANRSPGRPEAPVALLLLPALALLYRRRRVTPMRPTPLPPHGSHR